MELHLKYILCGGAPRGDAVAALASLPRLPRRAALLAGMGAAQAGVQRAAAWCGEPFPQWAYFLQWDEAALPAE